MCSPGLKLRNEKLIFLFLNQNIQGVPKGMKRFLTWIEESNL